MTTFSQMVDKIVAETLRPDLKNEIGTYLNQTIREVHANPKTNASVKYRDNYKEIALTSNVAEGFYWDIPKPSVFQGICATEYSAVWVDGLNPWAVETRPGPAMQRNLYGYYRAGSRVFFRNYGGNQATIKQSWFEFPPSLNYYELASRPAQYSDADGWTYSGAWGATPESQAAAQELVSNWILLRWAVVLEEGLRAKVYKRISDTERAALSYSMYSSQRLLLVTTESMETDGAM